jgi:hypothetical protein
MPESRSRHCIDEKDNVLSAIECAGLFVHNPDVCKRKEAFYEKFGFFKRPTDKFGYGIMVEL